MAASDGNKLQRQPVESRKTNACHLPILFSGKEMNPCTPIPSNSQEHLTPIAAYLSIRLTTRGRASVIQPRHSQCLSHSLCGRGEGGLHVGLTQGKHGCCWVGTPQHSPLHPAWLPTPHCTTHLPWFSVWTSGHLENSLSTSVCATDLQEVYSSQ